MAVFGGIEKNVDLDIFSGDYLAFEKYVAEKGIKE